MMDRSPPASQVPDSESERQVVRTEAAPAAVGPYSQAIRSGDFVFTAGQIGIDPQTGRLVAGGVASEVRQALANLEAVLGAAGASMDQVLKTTVYLTDMADFQAMNEVYAARFASSPPARAAVAVSALPLNARVQIELIARLA